MEDQPELVIRWWHGHSLVLKSGDKRSSPFSHQRPAAISARFLSESERVRITDLLYAGPSIRAIAIELGRSPSSVSRKICRNIHEPSGNYCPRTAHVGPRVDVSGPGSTPRNAQPSAHSVNLAKGGSRKKLAVPGHLAARQLPAPMSQGQHVHTEKSGAFLQCGVFTYAASDSDLALLRSKRCHRSATCKAVRDSASPRETPSRCSSRSRRAYRAVRLM